MDFKQHLNLLLERIFISTVSMATLEILDSILVKVWITILFLDYTVKLM